MNFKFFGILLASLLTLQISQAADELTSYFYCFTLTNTNAHNPENHRATSPSVYGAKNEEKNLIAKQIITGTTIEYTALLKQDGSFTIEATDKNLNEEVAKAFVSNINTKDENIFAVKIPLTENQQKSHIDALKKITENSDLAGDKAYVSVKCNIN